MFFLIISALFFTVGLMLFVFQSKQVPSFPTLFIHNLRYSQAKFVSAATNAFAALHILWLFAVTAVFIILLKREAHVIQTIYQCYLNKVKPRILGYQRVLIRFVRATFWYDDIILLTSV